MADDVDISDDTIDYVRVIDQKIGNKYGVSLLNVLTRSEALKGKENAKQIVAGLREDVSGFFDSLTSKLQEEQSELTTQLTEADTLYKRINDVIKNKASFASIPFIKPGSIDRDVEKEEDIIILTYDNSVDSLITRLVGVVHYVADLSTQYKDYNLGSWLFSGNKNYTLTINPPSSILFNIEVSKNEINFKLDSVGEEL